MDQIISAPAENAKAVLIALCSDDSSLRSRAHELLDDIDALRNESAPSDNQGVKRKADSTIAVCVQCQEPFYEDDNTSRACRYHSGSSTAAVRDVISKLIIILAGNLLPDYDADVWADHDENCHGVIDTDEMRMEFPDGFVWDCCDKPGHRRGCTRGRHDATSSSRGRYGTEPSSFCPVEETSDAVTSELDVESGVEEEEEDDGDDEDGQR